MPSSYPTRARGPTVDMVLLDWTRMGNNYCLAGAIADDDGWRIVRPLWVKHRSAAVRNVGWSAFQTAGRHRWQALTLVEPRSADPLPPHLEDVWVRDLRSQDRLATSATRRAILEATLTPEGEALFGSPLKF